MQKPPANTGDARDLGLILGFDQEGNGRRKWQPTPVFLPGKSPGQRSLLGYSPWSHKESDTTEAAHELLQSQDDIEPEHKSISCGSREEEISFQSREWERNCSTHRNVILIDILVLLSSWGHLRDLEQGILGEKWVVIIQSLSRVQLFVTPRTAAHQASLSITIFWSLLKLMSIESVMPSNHLIFCWPLLLPTLVFPSIRVFSNESLLPIRWPKYWSFSFSISPSNEYSRLITFGIDWFDLLAVQGTQESSPAPQFESINSSALSLFYGPALTSIHDYYKNHSFDYMDLCRQSTVSAF